MVNKGNGSRCVCGLQGPAVTRLAPSAALHPPTSPSRSPQKGLSHTDGRFVVDVVGYKNATMEKYHIIAVYPMITLISSIGIVYGQ